MSQGVLGFSIIWTAFMILWGIKRSIFISVDNETEALIIRFGKLIKKINEPGLHFCPHFLPWIRRKT